MRAGDLKPGQWFWYGESRLCVGKIYGRIQYCNSRYSFRSMTCDIEVELLPPDAGYDYVRPQPIDEVKGWRSLSTEELIIAGDEYLSHAGEWMPSVSVGIRMLDSHRPIRRRIAPHYRPFASAAEFAPHRDRWQREKETVVAKRVLVYSDRHVEFAARHAVGFTLLCREWVFADTGLPVGVEVKP